MIIKVIRETGWLGDVFADLPDAKELNKETDEDVYCGVNKYSVLNTSGKERWINFECNRDFNYIPIHKTINVIVCNDDGLEVERWQGKNKKD